MAVAPAIGASQRASIPSQPSRGEWRSSAIRIGMTIAIAALTPSAYTNSATALAHAAGRGIPLGRLTPSFYALSGHALSRGEAGHEQPGAGRGDGHAQYLDA